MNPDRRAPPSYNYEPPPPPDDIGALITGSVLWGGLAIFAAVQLYLALRFISGPYQ